MAKHSAGILAYRSIDDELQVLLVHPGGPLWRSKDEGAWSIPKGEYGPDEDPLAAAMREFAEEMGQPIHGQFLPLTAIDQAGGKSVCAWAVEVDFDCDSLHSNTFHVQWPPHSGRMQEFPEVDRAEWFAVHEARGKILSGQLPLIDELVRLLSGESG